jgi:dihydroorotate dehydrogenase
MSKYDLAIDPPLMNAAGSLGFVPDLHSLVDLGKLGAFVTNPVSAGPRTPAHGRRFLPYPGGFMLHTGYPNPGLSQVLRRHAGQWRRSRLPVIVHLLAQGAEDAGYMARRLETVEGVIGLEVGLPKEASIEMVIALTLAACGELPVIVRLPLERAVELVPSALAAGATAVSLAPPRGMSPIPGGGEMAQGRLYGPAVLPMALATVRELAQLGVPTIGAGGVYAREHMEAMLASGALAVQVDSVLWRGGWI